MRRDDHERTMNERRTETKHVAYEIRELGLVQLNNADVMSEAIGANTNADGRSPDNISNNTVGQLAPLLRQRDEESFERGDAPVRLAKLGGEVCEHLLRVWESDLPCNPVGIGGDRPVIRKTRKCLFST